MLLNEYVCAGFSVNIFIHMAGRIFHMDIDRQCNGKLIRGWFYIKNILKRRIDIFIVVSGCLQRMRC